MESKKNKISFAIFIITLLIFAVGGYFAMRYFSLDKTENVEKPPVIKKTDYRIDTSKDYIYFENVKRVIAKEEIDFQDVVINLECASDINNALKNEENNYRNSIKYIKDNEVEDELKDVNDEGIYSLSYREYYNYTYKDYISLVLIDFDYDIANLSAPKSIKSYLFNKQENNMIEESELLQMYNTSLDKIKDKIKTKLSAEQVVEDDMEVIKIEDTLSNFDYSLYINKIGKLEISYIVRSTKQNYYDNIVID